MGILLGAYLDDIYRVCIKARRNIPKGKTPVGGNAKNIVSSINTRSPFTTFTSTPMSELSGISDTITQTLPGAYSAKMNLYTLANEVAVKSTRQGTKVAGRLTPFGVQGPLDTTYLGTLTKTTLQDGTRINTMDLNLSQYYLKGFNTYQINRGNSLLSGHFDDLAIGNVTMDVAYKNGNKLGSRVVSELDGKTKSFYNGAGNLLKKVEYRPDGTKSRIITPNGTINCDKNGIPIMDYDFSLANLI